MCLPGMLAGFTNADREGFLIERVHTSRWGSMATLFRAVCRRCRARGLWRQTPKRAHGFSGAHVCEQAP